ncbi:MAG: IS66 family transposase [Bacteroidales bacterium]|nr:IS66 family transposase [Bacteroidales bacterium]
MKKNRSDIEFYQNMMDMLQQEKASLKEQLDAERKSREEETRLILEENRALRAELVKLTEQLRKREEEDRKKDNENKELMNRILSLQTDLGNAMAAVRLGRGKRFGPSSEKKSLTGKDRADRRADEKDDFDGTPPAGGCSAPSQTGDSGQKQEPPKRKKKKSEGRKMSLEDYGCDETVRHELGDYFSLPEGAVFKTRNGEVETHEYVTYEYVPGRVVKHIWVTASYQDSLGDIHNTLPAEERDNPVKGCPFSAEMLAFILVEKYAYHTPKNRIKRKLREMGAVFSKSTFVRYYGLAASSLRDMLGDTLRRSITEGNYLMIDETCELVGVIDPETGMPEYRKRYLWAFYNPMAATVMYLYEKGSRARKVVTDMLEGFRGTISTDGYEAYRIFDTDSHPHVLHCGCWAHVRRKVLEALGVATDICNELLESIQELFVNEKMFSGLDSEVRRKKRKQLSRPIVNRIFDTAERIARDTALMGKDLLRKAVNYIRNQKESLRNFLLDGTAELSNNGCEQRMKPIKLDLKNSQNIGSEEAAEGAAFMHSLVESCRMNGKNPYDYLVDLLRKLGKPLDDLARRELLPDRWQPQC